MCLHCSAATSDVSCVHADNFTNGGQDLLSEVNAVNCFTLSGDFQWGDISGGQFCEFIVSAYKEVVHWRPNVFMIPFGKAGKSFVLELAKLYQAFADQSALHSIALMACSVMQPLLLQKPYKQSKAKDHSICLGRRLDLWRKGCFTDLLNECRIQQHLRNPQSRKSGSHSISRLFDHLMAEGKVNMALRLLAEDSKGGVLLLDSSIPSGTDSSGNPAFRPVRHFI